MIVLGAAWIGFTLAIESSTSETVRTFVGSSLSIDHSSSNIPTFYSLSRTRASLRGVISLSIRKDETYHRQQWNAFDSSCQI